MFNLRLGLTSEEDKLPARLTEEYQIPGDKNSRVPLKKLRKDYYRKRGWDNKGCPLDKTICNVGITVSGSANH
jgi:aldehyde:ferredoxin oxidoreductase